MNIVCGPGWLEPITIGRDIVRECKATELLVQVDGTTASK